VTGEYLFEAYRVCGERYWSELTESEIEQWKKAALAVNEHAREEYKRGYNEGHDDGYSDGWDAGHDHAQENM
jgi:flagellar biosynthesis/type III secretory pathway protein FliH